MLCVYLLNTFIIVSFSFPLLENCDLLDLTHDFSEQTRVWNGQDHFKLEPYFKGISAANFYYTANKLSAAEHAGTHLDAPSHFSQTGIPAEKITLKNLIGEACVVDVSSSVKTNGEYQMTVADLQNWETQNGNLTSSCILLMRTDWSLKYDSANDYFGSHSPKNASTYHFPGLHPDTAQWLVDNRHIKMFGLDTPSQDFGASKDFLTHQIFASHNISGMENLKNLNQLPRRGATIVAMPEKIMGGSGAPLRAFAFGWNGPHDPCKR